MFKLSPTQINTIFLFLFTEIPFQNEVASIPAKDQEGPPALTSTVEKNREREREGKEFDEPK